MEKKHIIDHYSERAGRFGLHANAYRKLLNWLALLRFILFAGGLASAILLFRVNSAAGFAALFAVALLFGFLLRFYSRITWKRDFNLNMEKVNILESAASSEDYSAYDPGSEFIDPSHLFSHDIDLFGRGSVFQSLNRSTTFRGKDKLAGWLLDPYNLAPNISERQQAVRELIHLEDWRHEYTATGMMSEITREDSEELIKWLNDGETLKLQGLRLVMIYALPVLTLALLALAVAGILAYSWFILVLLINLFIIAINLRTINLVHGRVSRRADYLRVIGNLAGLVARGGFKSSVLGKISADVGTDEKGAVIQVRRLKAIIQSFDSRLNMLIGGLLNGLLLWDLHCVRHIDAWKTANRDSVPLWFDALAEIEAYSSLAGFAFNNPSFSWPSVSKGEIYLEAVDLGHHLIFSEERVTNNYIIEAPGTVNVITGANMAGKSTFLRTVGVNLVLAMSGAPVCASRFIFTPAAIFSSMRTSDSLSDHESYFFAELKRLKILIESLEKGEKVFFMLDEILKGTNSRDKSEGSKAFIEKVISLGGTGIVATHDVSLGELEKTYPGKVVNNCFEVEIEGGEILFDYLLYDGITTRMNAALLLKQHGII